MRLKLFAPLAVPDPFPPEPPAPSTRGQWMVRNERLRQIEVEGYTAGDDDRYEDQELVDAAHSYWLAARIRYEPRVRAPGSWPWETFCFNPCDLSVAGRVRNLTKAGALYEAHAALCRRRQQWIPAAVTDGLAQKMASEIDALLEREALVT